MLNFDKNGIPSSDARNAYDLLEDVKAAILNEPAGYNQEWVKSAPKEGARKPVCGTLYCVAGWVQVLRGKDPCNSGWRRAETALGLKSDQGIELFEALAIDQIYGEDAHSLIGTPEYAEMGAQHISNFQAKYKDQLKAKRIKE